MRAIEFLPVIGMPIGMNRIITSDASFTEKAYEVTQLAAIQSAFTAASMSTNYITANKAVNVTKLGIQTARASPVLTSGALTVIAQIQLADKKGYVPTGGQGSGFGATFSFFESLGITI